MAALTAALSATAAELEIAVAFRSEAIPFETADLTSPDFLAGKPAATPRTIAGELSLPIGEAVRVPALILLHGDGGLIANQPPWVRLLNRAGIAVFSVDSASGRGTFAKTQSLALEGAPNIASRLVDAYRALDRLSRHPRIDPGRIALMGVSSGGTAARWAATLRFAAAYAAPGQRFAAFVALYPNCGAQLRDDTRLVEAPMRVHHGRADVITASEYCSEWVQRSRATGADVEFQGYDGAGHGFDAPDNMPALGMPQVPNFSRCRLRETDDGRLVNSDTGAALGTGDACVGEGLSGGPHAAARAAAHTAVTAFLTSVLKPADRASR